MGYDLTRFKGEVDEELICPICSDVLEEPLQSSNCEHAFCGTCIKEWVSREKTCPVDRQPMQSSQLKPASRLLKNLLSRLSIECDNASFGCETIVKLDLLSMHSKECDFNPKKVVPCDSGCGIIMPKDELKEHNCVKVLRIQVQQQNNQILKLQQQLQQQSNQILTLQQQLQQQQQSQQQQSNQMLTLQQQLQQQQQSQQQQSNQMLTLQQQLQQQQQSQQKQSKQILTLQQQLQQQQQSSQPLTLQQQLQQLGFNHKI